METVTLLVIFTYIFKITQLLAGVLIVYWGYRISIAQKNRRVEQAKAEVESAGLWSRIRIGFNKIPTGPFLVICGVIVIGFTIFKGIDADLENYCNNRSVDIFIPEKLPR